jgi:hypothetical protein
MKSSDLAQTEFHDEGPYNKYLVLLVWKKWGRGHTSNRVSVLKLTIIRNQHKHDDADFSAVLVSTILGTSSMIKLWQASTRGSTEDT